MNAFARLWLARYSLARRALQARMAALLGAVLLGLVAIVFAKAGDWSQHSFAHAFSAHPLLTAASTPFVFALVVAMTRRWFPEARGSGIPQVMAAVHHPSSGVKSPLISLRTAAAKLGCTLLMLLGGGAVGREGLTSQRGAHGGGASVVARSDQCGRHYCRRSSRRCHGV